MEMVAANGAGGGEGAGYGKREHQRRVGCGGGAGRRCFQMPLHYPRYTREDYEAMPEWQLDRLLSDYGLPVDGTIHLKRSFAMGAFLWGGGGAAGAGH